MSNLYSNLLRSTGNVTSGGKNSNAVGTLRNNGNNLSKNNKLPSVAGNNGNGNQSVMGSLLQQLSNATGTMTNKASDTLSNFQNQMSNTANQVRTHVGKMSTTERIIMVLATIAIIVVIIYVIYLIFEQSKNLSATNEPIFFPSPGKDAKKPALIPNSKIVPSDDNTYTWSVWVRFYPKWFGRYRYNQWRSFFFKGSAEALKDTNIDNPPEAPGVWVLPNSNNVLFSIQTHSLEKSTFELSNIQIGEWVNLVVVANKSSVDIYRDGKLESTHVLPSQPKQNNYPVHVNYDDGFGGRLSYLQYFPRALEPREIEQIHEDYKKTVNNIPIDAKEKHPPCTKCKWEF